MAETRFPRLILATALPLALLAACGDDAAEEEVAEIADDGREASGEILPSSISDDMIATDRLRSQPPLMQDEPAARSGGVGNGAATDAEGDADEAAGSDVPDDADVAAAGLPPAPAIEAPQPEDVPLPND